MLPGVVSADGQDVVGRDGRADRVLLASRVADIERLRSAPSDAEVELPKAAVTGGLAGQAGAGFVSRLFVSGAARPGRRGRREVRPVWCLDQQPSEGFERDIRTCAEFAEQVGHPFVGQAGSDVVE